MRTSSDDTNSRYYWFPSAFASFVGLHGRTISFPPRLSCVLQSSFNETTRSSLKSARLRQSFEGIIHDVAILRENSLSFVRVEVVRLEIDSRIDNMDSIRGGEWIQNDRKKEKLKLRSFVLTTLNVKYIDFRISFVPINSSKLFLSNSFSDVRDVEE